MQKVDLVGYNSVADSNGLSSFVLPSLPLKSAKSREIPRKFELIAAQGHPRSRSSKVINLDANRKRICSFLLVIDSNFGRISYRFRDFDA